MTDKQRKAILDEYGAAPHGTKQQVAERHGVTAGTIQRWRRRFGERFQEHARYRMRAPEIRERIVADYEKASYGEKAELCRRWGVTRKTVSRWRSR